MFNGGETELWAIGSHNRNKDAGKFQEGGTAMMIYGNLIQQFDPEESGRDNLGLGRWTYVLFCSTNNTVTRVICGYSPCANKKKDSGTVYQQYCQHLINKLKDNTCPRSRFQEDLLRTMRQWRWSGERLILCLDANKKHLSGRAGAGTHGFTWPGDERGCGGLYHMATRGNVLPGKCADRCCLGHQRSSSGECMCHAGRIRCGGSSPVCCGFCHSLAGWNRLPPTNRPTCPALIEHTDCRMRSAV
jgi:hypothetical protein